MPDTPAPLSVVVPTRDRPDRLRRCLTPLRETLGPDDELLVVDSASQDPEVKEVAEAAGAVYVRCERPGASVARNVGWRLARHDLIAFVDDDVRVSPGWADGMREALVGGPPDVAFVTGRLSPGRELDRVRTPVGVKDDAEPAELGPRTRGVLGHSANLAVRRDALERVGGFDEALGAGGPFRAAEDQDLFDRLFALGLGGRYAPAAGAWHDQWRGRWALVRLNWDYGFGSGARLSKLVRTDPSRIGPVAENLFWTWGLRSSVGSLANGDKLGTVTPIVRMLAAALMFLRCLLVPVHRGSLVRRAP